MSTTECIVWIVDDDQSIRWVLEKVLQKEQIRVQSFERADHIIEYLHSLAKHEQPDLIISDIRMPGTDGISLLEQLKHHFSDLPVIIMTAHSDLDSAVSAYEGGAFEYLPKPFDTNEALDLVKKALKLGQHKKIRKKTRSAPPHTGIIGESIAMQEVFRAIGRLSRSNITVLITGESGTGKELVAEALHKHSPRSKQPFIALNMAAITRDLLESELFGHEKGAFTGAQNQRKGRFEQADGGTLFLDEIGDMPAELQTRLLRILADGQFFRIGGHNSISVDVRIIAATHQNLQTLVKQGKFREDLYHRLNVIHIHIPPLRERTEDIPLLAQYFLDAAAKELDVEPRHLDDQSKQFLTTLPWPGNVRQLQNVCRWLTVMSPSDIIHVQDMPQDLTAPIEAAQLQNTATVQGGESWEQGLQQWLKTRLGQGKQDILNQLLPQFERLVITTTLEYTHGKKQLAAKLLGWGRNTLSRKMRELNME